MLKSSQKHKHAFLQNIHYLELYLEPQKLLILNNIKNVQEETFVKIWIKHLSKRNQVFENALSFQKMSKTWVMLTIDV